MELDTRRVPQVRLSVPGPKMILQMLSLGGLNCPKAKNKRRASPVFFNPGTLGRTWGTRLVLTPVRSYWFC